MAVVVVVVDAVVIDAFVRTNSTDPKVIGSAIKNAKDVHGATGDLTYLGLGGVPDKPVFVHQVVGGAPTLVATID